MGFPRTRRVGSPRLALALVPLIAILCGCGAQSLAGGGEARGRDNGRRGLGAHQATTSSSSSEGERRTIAAASAGGGSASAAADSPPQIAVLGNPVRAKASWRAAVSVNGKVAVWVAQRPGVSLLRFDQSSLTLKLHAGIGEPVGAGWAGGSAIGQREAKMAVAGFNGGFRLNLADVGFLLHRRVGVPLHAGLASVVTYAGGQTDIGSWRSEVPSSRAPIASVLQNLHLLIDEGHFAPTLGCVQECWGATLGGGIDVARSGLGIRSDGQLIWAGGESLSPSTLARALLAAGARRAVQLDINPEWVASYLYVHREGRLLALQVVPTQPGIPGQLLSPYNRDFFTVLAR